MKKYRNNIELHVNRLRNVKENLRKAKNTIFDHGNNFVRFIHFLLQNWLNLPMTLNIWED